MSSPEALPAPRIPQDVIVYAVGDVHGRLDLVRHVTDALRAERLEVERLGKRIIAVFLGDLIDRGPESAGVVEHLVRFQKERVCETVFLRGNHEQVLLDLFEGVDEAVRWLDFGGEATLRSYGWEVPEKLREVSAAELREAAGKLIPPAHLDFIRATEPYKVVGDYVFVHAGLRPDRLLEEQSLADMLWFRFYDEEPPVHGHFVVHGHSENDAPVSGRWRVGIDTAAYRSGLLTVIRLQGEDRAFFRFDAGSNEIGVWELVDRGYGARREGSARRAASSRRGSQSSSARGGRPLAWKRLAAVGGGASLLLGAAGLAAILRGPGPATDAPPVAGAQPPTLPPRAATPALARTEGPGGAARPEAPAEAQPVAQVLRPLVEGYAVQVAALPSPELADTASTKFAAEFSDLGGRMTIAPVEIGSRRMYRVLVAGFSGKLEAQAYCRKLTARGQACLLRKLSG